MILLYSSVASNYHMLSYMVRLGDIVNKIKSSVERSIDTILVRDGFNSKAQAMIKKSGDRQISSI